MEQDEAFIEARKQAFIQQFQLENEVEEEDLDEEEYDYVRERRRSVLFWCVIGFFTFCPFILSGMLLYTLARYDQLIGAGGLEFLSQVLSSGELKTMSQETGVPELELFVSIHENRNVIIALIFTFFILLIAVLIALRTLVIYLRNRNG